MGAQLYSLHQSPQVSRHYCEFIDELRTPNSVFFKEPSAELWSTTECF
jgi:NH3-dependent NAD+ synthetase